MQQDNHFDERSDLVSHENEQIIAQRREAIQKLGKFSLYATPVLLGVVSKNADAQVGPGYS